jgi:hypothetical protein
MIIADRQLPIADYGWVNRPNASSQIGNQQLAIGNHRSSQFPVLL